VFRALSRERLYGPIFLMQTTITGIVCLDMLQQFLVPQLDEDDQDTSSLPWRSARVLQCPFPRSVD
jgi:hypothetical protein